MTTNNQQAPGGDLGEVLETGQQSSQPADAKAMAGDADLDWLEKMAPVAAKPMQKPQEDEELRQKQQLERLKEIDKKRSDDMYKEIQQEIERIRKKQDSQPRKYISGTTGFEADPEVRQKKFLEQQKKKDDDLSAATKASMGTGEANRGAVG